ncbi:MAG: glycosyltransferase [Patescibacteria group bacterium]
MEKINIIMFSMSHYTDWQKGQVNRNYHILNELQKDERIDKIISIDFLPFNWRKVAKIYWENIMWGEMDDIEIVYGDLTSSCHRVNSKLYIYSTIDSIYSHQTVTKELKKIIKILNLDNIVFWSYNPLFTCILEDVCKKNIERRAFVFDAVDNWSEHPAFQKYKDELRIGYQIIRQDADIIFTVSDYLKHQLFEERKNCYWIPNGINPEHFMLPKKDYQEPAELKNIPRPIIGYHGVVQGRLDLELIEYVAQKNPDKSIVLIGTQVWKNYNKIIKKKLQNYKNIYLIPFISYQKLPHYLHTFNAGIIPHKINEFTKSMNPLKLYEYSAVGIPTITTSVAGISTFGNILYLANNPEDFNSKIQLALREDNDQLRQTRREVIADDSWFSRAELMLKYLFDQLR